jgi:hypothetical protein
MVPATEWRDLEPIRERVALADRARSEWSSDREERILPFLEVRNIIFPFRLSLFISVRPNQ